MKLSAAHIDGIHFCRAPAQQNLRKPARGRPDIQTDPARRIDTEVIQPGDELQRRPADPGMRRFCVDNHIGRDFLGGLGNDNPVCAYPPGINRRARLRPRVKITVFNKIEISAHGETDVTAALNRRRQSRGRFIRASQRIERRRCNMAR